MSNCPTPLPSNIKDLEKRPEAKNLLRIFSSLNNLSLEQTIKIFEGKNFSEYKEKLSQVLSEKLEPISKENRMSLYFYRLILVTR